MPWAAALLHEKTLKQSQVPVRTTVRRTREIKPDGTNPQETGAGFAFVEWAHREKFDYPEGARHLFAKCGSAAEAFLLRDACSVSFLPKYSTDRVETINGAIHPQFSVAGYRVDFAVFSSGVRVAVEVDGGQYHHRSSEQVQYDYLRARSIMQDGYIVVRFTAAECFADPARCWSEIGSIVDRHANS